MTHNWPSKVKIIYLKFNKIVSQNIIKELGRMFSHFLCNSDFKTYLQTNPDRSSKFDVYNQTEVRSRKCISSWPKFNLCAFIMLIEILKRWHVRTHLPKFCTYVCGIFLKSGHMYVYIREYKIRKIKITSHLRSKFWI